MNSSLFSSFDLRGLSLNNRMVLAPMTRSRAIDGNVPNPLAAEYYAQRSTGGLLITEATQISQQGVGYPSTPGIHSSAQVEGWKAVTKAVHEKGGKIFLQLWHVGRISHPLFQPNNELPVAPSAIAPKGSSYTSEGMKEFVTPRALEIPEIKEIIGQFAEGAKNAKAAGFDGVEIHGANGYLIDQFLRDGSNRRTDEYGGSMENRIRFALQVTDAVCAAWSADRVAIRISPSGVFNDMSDSDPKALFALLAKELSKRSICYLHLVEATDGDVKAGAKPVYAADIRPSFSGPLMVNAGYTKERAESVLASGDADLVSFGAIFLANPDLPRRFERGLPLNKPDTSTFYGGGEKGYTDYPFAG